MARQVMVKGASASIYQFLNMDMGSALEMESRSVALSIAIEDANNAIDAFLKKEKVMFKGK